MICHHCGREVPRGAFCTVCGTAVTAPAEAGGSRHAHFAAHPGEHVAQPSVFTTLLPHLHHTKMHEFRFALLAGLAVVMVMGVLGFVAGALFGAVILVPALYVVYMYETRVYGDTPAGVVMTTIGGGAVLGAAAMLITHIVTGDQLHPDLRQTLLLLLVIPLIQIMVMPIPALVLRKRFHVGVIDGLSLGAAAGLGFAAGEGIVRFLPVFPVLSTRSSAMGWIYALISAAVLMPLMHATSAGAMAMALWRPRGGHAGLLRRLAVPIVAIAAVAFSFGGQFLQDAGATQLVVVIYQFLMAALIVIFIRFFVHHALIDELGDVAVRPVTCTRCGNHGDYAGFCGHCGAVVPQKDVVVEVAS